MRQVKRVAIMGAVGMMGLVMWTVQGAEPYPNPHRIVRYLDAEADTTVNGVVNNGTIYKRGKGTATLPAPALNGGGSLVVSEGGVARWNDDGILRVCAAEPSAIDAGALLDAASGEKPLTAAQPQENAQLKLVRSGAILARGHLGRIGSQSAFLVESAANG